MVSAEHVARYLCKPNLTFNPAFISKRNSIPGIGTQQTAGEVLVVRQKSGNSLESRKPGNFIIYFPNVTLPLESKKMRVCFSRGYIKLPCCYQPPNMSRLRPALSILLGRRLLESFKSRSVSQPPLPEHPSRGSHKFMRANVVR